MTGHGMVQSDRDVLPWGPWLSEDAVGKMDSCSKYPHS